MLKQTDKADKANCTYWWYIHLNDDNKRNILTGYSKFLNQSEAMRPADCLMSKIEMLQKNNWLTKCTKIDIFRRLSPLPNAANDMLILTLFPTSYLIPADLLNYYNNDSQVKNFLNNFYQCINEGKPVKYLRPLADKTKSKDKFFDLSKLHFKKLNELSDYTFKLLNNGHAKGEVEHFYRSAIIKFFPNL